MTKTHGQRYLGCKQRLCWSASESLCSAATGCYHRELRLASQVLGGASEPWWASIRKQNNVFCSNCILRSLNCTYMYSMYTHTYLLFTTSHMKVISIALMCGFSHTHTHNTMENIPACMQQRQQLLPCSQQLPENHPVEAWCSYNPT